jgi:hypothetical protein
VIRPANTPSIRVAERLGETYHRTVELLGDEASIYRITEAVWAVDQPAVGGSR